MPTTPPEHVVPQRAAFAPWHKVRKQFIRQRQWNWLILKLAKRYLKAHLQEERADWSVAEDDTDAEDSQEVPESVQLERPLRFLVIPGDDLLDVRSLCNEANSLSFFIRYLGFNDGHGSDELRTRLHIANNQVTSFARVAKDSLVLHDRFQEIAKPNSQAHGYLKRYGPFHVVNLDLCDSLFPTITGHLEDYFSALHRLIEYQMANQTTPWLLFITTEVAPREVDPVLLTRFCKPTRDNCDMHSQFAAELSRLLPAALLPLESPVIDATNLTEEEMAQLFGIALSKTLLGFAKTASPQWKVEMLTSHKYTVNQELHVSMLSLAYQFRPITSPPLDPTGISAAELVLPSPFDELGFALKMISAVERISDVDSLLIADPALRDEILNSSADLLASAGYDRQRYVAWVNEGEGNVQGA
ncbi:MAG: hypothetical protein AABP62_14950 [Planctomycetota bacterium]